MLRHFFRTIYALKNCLVELKDVSNTLSQRLINSENYQSYNRIQKLLEWNLYNFFIHSFVSNNLFTEK